MTLSASLKRHERGRENGRSSNNRSCGNFAPSEFIIHGIMRGGKSPLSLSRGFCFALPATLKLHVFTLMARVAKKENRSLAIRSLKGGTSEVIMRN